MKPIDTKKILAKARIKPHKVKVSFTLDAELFETFRTACDKESVAQSRVVEALIAEFLEAK